MKHEDIIKYMEAVKRSQTSLHPNGVLHRCPRCGSPLRPFDHPAFIAGPVEFFTEHFDGIKICHKCRVEERHGKRIPGKRDCSPDGFHLTWFLPSKSCRPQDRKPEMLENWWIIQAYDTAGPFPSDIHFQVVDPEVNDDKTITFLCECWFDWKKFGLDPAIFEDDDTWMNVYLTVDPKTRAVSMVYTIDDNCTNENFVFVLNEEDQKAALDAIDRYCTQHGETLQEIVDSIPVAEHEFEIPVKEINYGVARIRASSLEAALEKVHDAYGNGEIEWGKIDFDFTVPTGGADNA